MNGDQPTSPSLKRSRYALLAFTLITIAGVASPAARLMPLVFPALSFGLALYLHKRFPRYYVSLVCWLFFLTPLVRRLIEFRTGSSGAATVMVAPFLACIAGIAVFRDHWFRIIDSRLRSWMLVLGAIAYAMVVGTLLNPVVGVLQDAFGWLSPLCFALYLYSEREHFAEIFRGVQTSFIYGVGLMSVYGLYQFFILAPWDAAWMENSGLTSIGLPQPMQVRLFSTMNTPQPFADYLIVGILLSFVSKRWLRFLIIPLALVSLGLTMSRSGWMAAVVGLIFLSLVSTARQRMQLAVGVFVCIVGLAAATQIPEISDILSRRLQSLSNLQTDGSYNDRVASQNQAINLFQSSPFGIGLGADARSKGEGPSFGVPQPTGVALGDNGIEEIMLTFGWFGSAVFIFGLGGAVILCFQSVKSAELVPMKAILAALLLQIPILGIFPGASGFLLWSSIGLCTAWRWSSAAALSEQVASLVHSSPSLPQEAS